MKISYLQVFLVVAGFSGNINVAAAPDPRDVKSEGQRKNTDAEDAEFWERFLGNYVKVNNKNPHPTEMSLEMSLTPPPSPPPNSLPTRPTTLMPAIPPSTSTPTPPPTPAPTPGPTPPPTPAPTPGPSPRPTPAPTPGPSPRPTPAPTPGTSPRPTPPPTTPPTSPPTPPPTTTPPTNPPTVGPCILNVTVNCKLENGLPCHEKKSPEGTCDIGSEISVLTFSYQPDFDCSESKNMRDGISVCQDLAPLGDGSASVTCIDLLSSSILTVEPAVVDPDQIFTVKSPSGGELPAKIECVLTSTTMGTATGSQVIVIDVSGDVTLNLKDKFGAMQLENCDEQVCIEMGCFEYVFENAGSGDMKVINVERTINGGSLIQLVDQVSPNPLAPGEVATIEEKIPIDYCQGPAVEVVKIYAEVENAIGAIYFDEDEYDIPINSTPRPSPPVPPPTPPPVPGPTPVPPTTPTPIPMPSGSATTPPSAMCSMEISATCENCDFNTSMLPGCEARPTMLGMLFRGGGCDENNFAQPIENVTCADFNGGPPKLGSNAAAYIEYTGKNTSEAPIFTGTVREGDVFYLYNGGEQMDADLNFNIWSDSSKATLLQSVFFDASCSLPLALKNVFGATQIIQFANALQGNVSCFISIEVSYTISAPLNLPAGEDSLIIRELSIRTNYTNPTLIDFTDVVNGTIVGPARHPPLEVSIEATLNLAIPQAYEMIMTVSGETFSSGQICRGGDYSVFFAPMNEAPDGWAPAVPTAPGPTAAPAPTAPLPTAPVPTAPLPTAPVPTAPLPTAPAPAAPLPTAVFPTVPIPTVPAPTAPVATAPAPTVVLPTLPAPTPTLPTVAAPVKKSKKKSPPPP